MIGTTIGYWTVLAEAGTRKERFMRCRCVCGIERDIATWRLKAGKAKSCGCSSNLRHGHGRHRGGRTRSPEYGVWCATIKRCENHNEPFYCNYGGRGVTVCERWHTFENFLADMGSRPSKGHSIDRIDNARGYEPGNCRWATRETQNRNRRNVLWVTFEGQRVALSSLARRFGLTKEMLRHRVKNMGMTVEEAIATPRMRRIDNIKKGKAA